MSAPRRRQGGRRGPSSACTQVAEPPAVFTNERPRRREPFPRRPLRRVATLTVAACTGLLLIAAPAGALSKHVFSTSFAGSGAGTLSNPSAVAVDPQSHDVYVINSPINERQTIEVDATGGSYTLTFRGQSTAPIPYNASAQNLKQALLKLRTIGRGIELHDVEVTGGEGQYTVEFRGTLVGVAQPLLDADGSGLSGGASTVTIATSRPASNRADVEKLNSSGEFILMFGKGVDKTKGEEAASTEAEQNLCTAASGDECQAGAPGTTPGAFTDPEYLAVDRSDGDVYVADHATGKGSGDVQKFDSSGGLVTGWGQGGLLDGSNATDGSSFTTSSSGEGLTGMAVDLDGNLFVHVNSRYFEFTPDGDFLRDFATSTQDESQSLVVDSSDSLYYVNRNRENTIVNSGVVIKVSADGQILGKAIEGPQNEFADLGIDSADRDLYLTLNSGKVEHFLGSCDFVHEACAPFDTFGAGHLSDPAGVAVDESTGTVYVADAGDNRIAVFSPVPFLPDLSASAEPLAPTRETLAGHVDPAAAGEITACRFEYVTDAAFGKTGFADLSSGGSVPCAEGQSFPSPADVDAEIEALAPGSAYHFRLLAKDSNGTASTYPHSFETLPLPPELGAESASAVLVDTALVHTQVNPGGGDATYHTVYHVEYVRDEQFQQSQEEGDEGFAAAASTPSLDLGSGREPQSVTVQLSGLAAGTTYHYRVFAGNVSGTEQGLEHTFTTLSYIPSSGDACPNAHARQQTGAALLLDCRAYELVSAADSGGYDVESNLIAGQTPFPGYPQADGRVLYGVDGGGIPRAGEPTNRGVDPYVASRSEEGWSTEYVGIPAGDRFAQAPFSSPLLAADAGLQTFAFGGPGLCSPCFGGSGVETGIPLHLAGGALVQGMAGQFAEPEAKPDGYIARYLSANGEHLVFGSTSQFAEGGNEETGDVSIYDRNLTTGKTFVVSNTSETEDFPVPLPCLQGAHKCNSAAKDGNGIGELDISSDGSRIVVAQKVSEDADHNVYWHPYLNVGDSPKTIDLLPPSASHGVLYDGMSADGAKIFFTSTDRLLPAEDTDSSADLYMWSQQGEEEGTPLTLVSTGTEGAGNSDSCDPVPNSARAHWNTVGPEATCGAVAIGGGGGVATAAGSIYFLSPELLAGASHGVADQPNLYFARPGQAPRFLATLAANDPTVLDAVSEAGTRRTADFQVTPGGDFAAFPSTLSPLPGFETAGHTELYRYDAVSEALACVSCSPTETPSEGDASLAANGLSLIEGGRVFFNAAAQLAATDTDNKQDVYEWSQTGAGNCTNSSPTFSRLADACLALISAGTSTFDSGLLSATAGGKDVYFFTRDSLTPSDENGPTMKIYDAREAGGFPFSFPPVACKASDECHGPSSPAPGPLVLGSGTVVRPEGLKKCKQGFVRRHGKCVHKHRRRVAHHRGGKR